MSQFKSNEEAVNMVVLYFINNFLLFKDNMKLVDDIDIKICASGAFDEYHGFNMTLQFI